MGGKFITSNPREIPKKRQSAYSNDKRTVTAPSNKQSLQFGNQDGKSTLQSIIQSHTLLKDESLEKYGPKSALSPQKQLSS